MGEPVGGTNILLVFCICLIFFTKHVAGKIKSVVISELSNINMECFSFFYNKRFSSFFFIIFIFVIILFVFSGISSNITKTNIFNRKNFLITECKKRTLSEFFLKFCNNKLFLVNYRFTVVNSIA